MKNDHARSGRHSFVYVVVILPLKTVRSERLHASCSLTAVTG